MLYGIPDNEVIPAVTRVRSADNGGFEEVNAAEERRVSDIYSTVAETRAKTEVAPDLPPKQPKQSFPHQLEEIRLACEEHDQQLGPSNDTLYVCVGN